MRCWEVISSFLAEKWQGACTRKWNAVTLHRDSKGTRNGQEKFLRREKFCSSADEQDFVHGGVLKGHQNNHHLQHVGGRAQGHNESDKPTGEC